MWKIILLVGLLAIVVSCVSQSPQNPKEMNNERLNYFSFNHHNTMARFNGESYLVNAQKDGRIHIVIDEGYPNEKDFYIDDTTIFDDLKVIVDRYGMDKYKKNYKPKMEICDGDSWTLYYSYDSRRTISSGGYMAWPDNYREARRAIGEYFQKWRDYPIQAKEINLFHYTCTNKHGCDIEYRLERGEQEATLYMRNAEYGTDKQLTVGNDHLTELQELVNIYRLKDESSRTTDDDSASFYRFFVSYNTGDTIDFQGYHTTFLGGLESAFVCFFDRWLPIRGNLTRLEYLFAFSGFSEVKYYVVKEDEGFSISHYDQRGNRREGKMSNEDMARLQKLVESFGLDKAEDKFTGSDTWFLFTDYDSRDIACFGGRSIDEASSEKAQHIFDALTAFFEPYLQ